MPIKSLSILFTSFCLFANCVFSAIPLFDPPSNWECAFPDQSSSCIRIGFLGKSATTFRPSINLAIEEVDVDLKSYLKAVKEIHLSDRGTTWRDLGKFMTRLGEGRLTEIGTLSKIGSVKMLQMIVIKDHCAYILTGAAIKEEFLKFQEDFVKTFQSFRLESNLFSSLAGDKKMRFEAFFSEIGDAAGDAAKQEAKWNELQKMVAQETSCMGNYWQFLVLKEGREKLYR
jgi:hypothetical protein